MAVVKSKSTEPAAQIERAVQTGEFSEAKGLIKFQRAMVVRMHAEMHAWNTDRDERLQQAGNQVTTQSLPLHPRQQVDVQVCGMALQRLRENPAPIREPNTLFRLQR